jgi:hypothetical protein
MTWKTFLGERVLEGTEAKLFLELVAHAIENIENFDGDTLVTTGNYLFDNSSLPQKIYLFHYCLSALLKVEIPAPELTHTLEATIYFVFAFLESEIKYEIDLEVTDENLDEKYKYYFRQMCWGAISEYVLPMWEEADLEYEEELESLDEDELEEPWSLIGDFSVQSIDQEKWSQAVDDLCRRILWDDNDFALSSLAPQWLDGTDEIAQSLGITDEYMSNRLPIVSEAQASLLHKEITQWQLD